LVADDEDVAKATGQEESLEQTVSLNEQRHGTVLAALRSCGAEVS
jgi:hypothetical protein